MPEPEANPGDMIVGICHTCRNEEINKGGDKVLLKFENDNLNQWQARMGSRSYAAAPNVIRRGEVEHKHLETRHLIAVMKSNNNNNNAGTTREQAINNNAHKQLESRHF
ncbi:hypothetical protein ACLKA7_003393 [Drosophila subpalustris]